MIPQHSGAPFRQQRWIEIENVGLVEIPAFACVEILDSYRPEKTGGKTPNAGRTVLKVGLVTRDNAPNTIINGPVAIPAGGKGRIGTMHDPMFAMVESAYLAGDTCGPVAEQWFLESGKKGYVALGDYIAGSPAGILRVMRALDPDEFEPPEKLEELCAQEDAERNVPYKCLLGEWSPSQARWCYSSEEVWAIDHRMGAPFAEEGWKGLYQKMECSMTVGEGEEQETLEEIWVCVSLDCELPPEGCSCEEGS
jgi:hypothetical protein